MKTILLLLAFTSIKSSPDCHGVTCPRHNTVEDCDGSFQLGDINLINTTKNVKNETYKTKGMQVMGCGYWMVYERKGHRGAEACLEASHGRLSLDDIGLRRVKSVYRRETPCPRVANVSVVVIVCVVLVMLAVLTVTLLMVMWYRDRQIQDEPTSIKNV